jgi:branched-chain amino acid transport system ATP-binding protein
MVAIGRALMMRPRLILMDEPSLGLSPIATSHVMRSIAQIRSAGVAICLVEQKASEAIDVADSIYVLAHGEVTFSGTKEEARMHPDLLSAYVG